MACPWLLLNNLFLTYGEGHELGEHNTLHELYPSNSNATAHGATCSSSDSKCLSPRTLKELATLPFFRTVVVRNALSTQTPVLDNLRTLYLTLGQFDVEYISRFGDIRPIFIVCRSPKAAELVLRFLPGITRSSESSEEGGFVGEIYHPAYWSNGRVEAWSHISLWVSIEGRDLRLRVRAVDDPFKGFRDLSWQFQGNCHHRSGENDHDKEGETTLWVETSGTRKDFTIPPSKGKRPERIQPHLGNRRTDGAIKTIQSGIQNRLSEGRVVAGLRLVFVNVQDSKELKRWLVSSSDGGNDNGGREFEYPPAFQVSAMRRSQVPVQPPPSWSSFAADSQTKPVSGDICEESENNSQKTNRSSHESSCQSETAGSQQIATTAHHYQHPVVDRSPTICNPIIMKTAADSFTADWAPGRT